MRPVATTRLMAAMQFSTPLEWCSMPRACSRKLVSAGPHISAARTIIEAGTLGDRRRVFRRVALDDGLDGVPAGRVRGDELAVDPAALRP